MYSYLIRSRPDERNLHKGHHVPEEASTASQKAKVATENSASTARTVTSKPTAGPSCGPSCTQEENQSS